MRACPDELRADFQEHYHLNIDGMGCDYTVSHAAALAAQLPLGSRCVRHDNPQAEWTQGEYILAEVAYGIALLVWMQTKDGQKGVNRPKRMQTPAQRAEMERRAASTDFDYIDEILKGGADGQ